MSGHAAIAQKLLQHGDDVVRPIERKERAAKALGCFRVEG